MIPCEIVIVGNIIDSEMRRKADEMERKTRRKNNGEQQQQQQQRGMRQGEDIESKVSVDSIESKLTDGNGNMPTAVASPVNTNVGHLETNINQFQPWYHYLIFYKLFYNSYQIFMPSLFERITYYTYT